MANYGSSSGFNGQQFQQKQLTPADADAVVSRPPVVIQSRAAQTATVIFKKKLIEQSIHSWFSSMVWAIKAMVGAKRFAGIFAQIKIKHPIVLFSDFQQYLKHVKFVCPNAKSTEEGMTQWF